MSESPSQMSLSVADATRSPNAVHPLPSPGSSTLAIPTSSAGATSNAQLAGLLADSCREAEHLRREVAALRKRAESAERKLHAFRAVADASSSVPNGTDSPATAEAARAILELEDRALRAEMAQQDAEARKAQLVESWQNMDRYLAVVELRAADARAGFSRVVNEGVPLVLGSIPLPGSLPMGPPPSTRSSRPSSSRSGHHNQPHTSATFPQLPLPPPPNPLPNSSNSGTRRPRTPSVDGSYQPPSKRMRGNSDEQRGRVSYPESHIPMPHHPDPRDYHSDPHAQHPSHPSHPQHPQHPQHAQQQQRARQLPAGARMIHPPSTVRRHTSRSRSRSSSTSSFDVDEMLIQATTGDENGGASTPNGTILPPDAQQQQQQLALRAQQHRQPRPSSSHSLHPGAYAHRTHPDSPPYARREGASAGPLPQPGQVQQYQTHVFAPVQTGAPQKKSKFPVGSAGSIGAIGGPIDAPQAAAAPPPQPYPPTNEAGQRICRQCGLPGRYKEGKCVEKWGPGPMGPGTVCDRCRKKMKRVERRGTLESQSQQLIHQQQQVAAAAGMQRHQGPGLQRTDTILTTPVHPNGTGNGNGSSQMSFSHGHREREREREEAVGTAQLNHSNLRTVIPSPGKHAAARPSPPPPIASLREHHDEQLPTSNIGRGASAASRAHSRSGSASHVNHNGRATGNGHRSARPTPPVGEMTNGGPKRSSLHSGSSSGSARSPGQMEVDETDADADADAEVEAEAEIVGAAVGGGMEVDVDGEGEGEGEDGEADADAEAELLEAVDAAEANSSSSGRMKSEDA